MTCREIPKGAIDLIAADDSFVRVLMVDPCCSEMAVRDHVLEVDLNDRSGDIGCNAASSALRLRTDAASAIAARAKGGFVRTV